MANRLRLLFPDEGEESFAELLEREAPRTCRAIWESLPLKGELIHGQWSGPETYLVIKASIRIGPENQTVRTAPGDIGYYAVEGGRLAGWPDDLAELAFFYDRGAVPSMITGPVAVNLFARVVDNLDGFAAMCRRVHREGVKRFRVERSG